MSSYVIALGWHVWGSLPSSVSFSPFFFFQVEIDFPSLCNHTLRTTYCDLLRGQSYFHWDFWEQGGLAFVCHCFRMECLGFVTDICELFSSFVLFACKGWLSISLQSYTMNYLLCSSVRALLLVLECLRTRCTWSSHVIPLGWKVWMHFSQNWAGFSQK